MKCITTIGIFAHANAGKTTLTENFLYKAGVIQEVGRVDSGNTITDNLTVERKRGITVRASYVTFTYADKKYQLIDTPGHVDFSAEVVRAINTLDIAVLVLSGVEGVEPQTTVIWDFLQKRKIPTVFFINKMDRRGADFERVINDIKKRMTKNIFIYNSPSIVGDELIINRTSTMDMLEQISMFSDVAMEHAYAAIENSTPVNLEMVVEIAREMTCIGTAFPVCAGSVLIEKGADELLDAIDLFMPFSNLSEASSEQKPFSAYIYSVSYKNDEKEIYAKILSGQISIRDSIMINGEEQKVKSIAIMNGGNKCGVDFAKEGQMVILSGLINIHSGDIIGEEIPYNKIDMELKPMFTSRVEVCEGQDMLCALKAFKCLNDEDSLLNIRYDPDSKNIHIDLMGELQAETVVSLLEEKYNVKVVISTPHIIYKETPKGEGFGCAGYKRCSNLALRIQPGERGTGIVFKSFIDTGVLTAPYQKQIERLIYQYSKISVNSWGLTDAEIHLVDGKYDHESSETFHFNIATPIAYMRALKESGTTLLEPTVEYEVAFLAEQISIMYSELISKSMEYTINNPFNGYQKIDGIARLSDIIEFAHKLKRITNGQGTIVYRHCGYIEYFMPIGDELPVSDYCGDDPRNEELFVQEKQGSMINLDKGIGEHQQRPERIKRNRRFWVNGRKPDYGDKK